MKEPMTTAPAMELTPQAIDNLVEELREYHAIYSPLFQRREQREGSAKYLHGLLLDIPRKSIEPMVLAFAGSHAKTVRTLQLFICEVPAGMAFKTKPAMGWEMLQEIHRAQTLRGRWVTCDEAFGRDKSLLDHIDGIGLWYFAEVPHDTQVW